MESSLQDDIKSMEDVVSMYWHNDTMCKSWERIKKRLQRPAPPPANPVRPNPFGYRGDGMRRPVEILGGKTTFQGFLLGFGYKDTQYGGGNTVGIVEFLDRRVRLVELDFIRFSKDE